MLVAISGSQGSGKSTIIHELKRLGYDVITRKTARSILDAWGTSLEDVYKDFDLNQAFHEELVRLKYADELESIISDKIIFTERTYADIFTYALISFGQHNKYDKWLDNYFKKCKEHCQNYDHVFYIKSNFLIGVENDGVRSINEHYSRLINLSMFDNIQQMIEKNNLTTIDVVNLADRVNIIHEKYKSK